VKAVIAESFERIHRSNLVGMGVLPLVFLDGQNRQSLKLNGDEVFDITGITTDISPRMTLNCSITFADGSRKAINLLCRVDTFDEVDQYKNGGIMQLVLRKVLKEA
jgi:aconitate hydratase